MNKIVSRVTFTVAIIIFFGGAFYGFKLVTSPVDSAEKGPTCENQVVKKGGDVTTNLIKVDVYNTSQRSGLANRVTINLQRNGFLAGNIGNTENSKMSKTVTIVTDNKKTAAIQLVAKQFKDKVSYAAPTAELKETQDAVTIVVGDDYSGLAKKPPRKMKTDTKVEFCIPIVTIN